MNVKQLEAFSLVMKTGSVSLTAQHLQISQPTVTRLLSELESSIDLKLFERKQGRLTIRAEALAFYDGVEKSFLGTDYLRRVAEDLRNNIGVHIRVAAFPSFGLSMMPAVLAPFHQDFPQVGVSLNIGASRMLIEAIASGTEDIGVLAGFPDHTGIEVIQRFGGHCVALLRLDDPLAKNDVVDLASCDQRTIIWQSAHTQIKSVIRKTIRGTSTAARGSIEVNLGDTACRLVELGQGIAIVNPINAKSSLNDNTCLRPITPQIPYEFAVVRSRKMNPTAAASALLERLIVECKAV